MTLYVYMTFPHGMVSAKGYLMVQSCGVVSIAVSLRRGEKPEKEVKTREEGRSLKLNTTRKPCARGTTTG